MSSAPVRLPATALLRPEVSRPKQNWLDKAVHSLVGVKRHFKVIQSWQNRQTVKAIHKHARLLVDLTDEQLKDEAVRLRALFLRSGHSRLFLVRAFALIREASGRALGMYHFDSQLLGGLVLYGGHVAEMQTGEGKTLTATLPAAAAALGGIPVHVITVNDYLASRDAETMAPVYEMLGLTVGCVVHDMTLEQRQQAYAKDVVYCTNKELVFDYLKDLLVLKGYEHPLHLYGARLYGNRGPDQQLMLRGLHYAIVDEADSVLLDEARSPLVISGTVEADEDQNRVYRQALELAVELQEDQHFLLDRKKRTIELLEAGEDCARERTQKLGAFWTGRIRRNELVHKALTALYLFERDHHYIVADGKVQIVDEHTGRVMADRSWEQGLHQLIEAKESCELTNPRDTLARISYQRFFRLYHHLSGMTGTGGEVAGELWQIYGMPVKKIPLHQSSKRTRLPVRLFGHKSAKWDAVVERIVQLRHQQRPVLIGTVSVAESEYLSELLNDQAIPHQLLNARNDEEEADIVTSAGQEGQVTVATSMAGRGTDIKLTKASEDAGGLHVILTEFHDASRIDRQLEGRCARQGDPGSFEVFVSMEDTLAEGVDPDYHVDQIRGVARKRGINVLKKAQLRLEKRHAVMRKDLFRQDEQRSEMLAFTSARL